MNLLKKKTKLIFSVLLLCIFIFPSASFSNSQDQQSKGLIDGVAYIILKAAWPTAKYESYSYEKTSFQNNGHEIVFFKINARSAFNDGPLWVEVKADFDENLKLVHIGWGDYKAFLPPGTTASAVAKLIDEANNSNQKKLQSNSDN